MNKFICRLLIVTGNSLTIIGCVGLILVLSGLVGAERLAIGISSGVRMIGSVAIAGCLLSAIAYGIVDLIEK